MSPLKNKREKQIHADIELISKGQNKEIIV
jgi:hypothetical protein